MKGDKLSVREVSERVGWDRIETLEKLQRLHEQHGNVLFRRPGRRTKLWVDATVLPIVWPERFGQPPTAVDLSTVHQRIDRAIELAERGLREHGRLSAEFATLRRRLNGMLAIAGTHS